MPTEETETSVELIKALLSPSDHYLQYEENCENQSRAWNLRTDWHVVSNGRVIAPPLLVRNFWPWVHMHLHQEAFRAYQDTFIGSVRIIYVKVVLTESPFVLLFEGTMQSHVNSTSVEFKEVKGMSPLL